MKKILCILLAALMLSGCRKDPPVTIEVDEPPVVETVVAALNAYEKVLLNFLDKHVNAAGEEVWFDGTFGNLEENSFAVDDVDGDGDAELVLLFSTAPMAGMCAWVYGYDAESDSVYDELAAFPALTFYTGGLLKAEWSHNQGLAGDALWPYALMKYDEAKRSYQVIAQVDAWNRELAEINFEGEPFPAEADPQNTGVVYLVTTPTDGTFSTKIFDRSGYDAWYADVMGGNTELTPEFLNTTRDNIESVSPF